MIPTFLHRYVELVYVPALGHPTTLEPVFRPKWARIKRDVWGWFKERFTPAPNPFDLALQDVMNSMLWEGT